MTTYNKLTNYRRFVAGGIDFANELKRELGLRMNFALTKRRLGERINVYLINIRLANKRLLLTRRWFYKLTRRLPRLKFCKLTRGIALICVCPLIRRCDHT